LEAGKHVVVEKPFVMDIPQGEELIKLAQEKNLKLSVFQNRRWDGDFLTVKQLVENDAVGRLVEFTSHYDRYRNYIEPDTWKEDGQAGTGVLYNLGTHMVDHALQLFGMPGKVYAHSRIVRTGGQVPDYFDLKLYYKGLDVNLRCSYLAREAGPRFQLHGTKGSYQKYGIDPQEAALKTGAIPQGTDWGKEPADEWGYLNSSRDALHYEGNIETLPGNYMAYFDNIADALLDGAELCVKPEESLDGLRVIEAARRSIKEEKVVSV
jgi:scyllo-inositol 2-dehydrogenase (NADP+)